MAKKNQKPPITKNYKEILRIDNETINLKSTRNYAGLLLLQNIQSNILINIISFTPYIYILLFLLYCIYK